MTENSKNNTLKEKKSNCNKFNFKKSFRKEIIDTWNWYKWKICIGIIGLLLIVLYECIDRV